MLLARKHILQLHCDSSLPLSVRLRCDAKSCNNGQRENISEKPLESFIYSSVSRRFPAQKVFRIWLIKVWVSCAWCQNTVTVNQYVRTTVYLSDFFSLWQRQRSVLMSWAALMTCHLGEALSRDQHPFCPGMTRTLAPASSFSPKRIATTR